MQCLQTPTKRIRNRTAPHSGMRGCSILLMLSESDSLTCCTLKVTAVTVQDRGLQLANRCDMFELMQARCVKSTSQFSPRLTFSASGSVGLVGRACSKFSLIALASPRSAAHDAFRDRTICFLRFRTSQTNQQHTKYVACTRRNTARILTGQDGRR